MLIFNLTGGGYTISKELLINHKIRSREVRVVDSEGEQLGVMPLEDALKIAQEKNLDLVNVAPQARPPVCRIMDFGRYKYEQSKRDKEARKKQKTTSVKEVKMRPGIDEHDFQVKKRNAVRFLESGDKVKVTIIFRGRQITHPELGRKQCKKMASELEEIATVEREPRMEGRNMVMFLAPR